MARPAFHALTVSDVRRETEDTVSVAFEVPPELAEAFAFAPGQFVTVRMTDDTGVEQRRSYSICSGLDDGELRIAVKHLPGGLFGAFAFHHLRPGDTVDVLPPLGRFTTAIGPEHSGRRWLLVAAGSGITPVMSLLRTMLAREPGSTATLLYGNRGPATTIFREELADLKDRYLGRLEILHVFSREQQASPLLNGRIGASLLSSLDGRLLAIPSYDVAFICGPEPMTLEVRDALLSMGMAADAVHVELFGSHLVAPARQPVEGGPTARLDITLNGIRREVLADPDETVLDAGRRAGLDLPYSCKGGVCATCRAKVCDGSVEMAVNYALEPWETEAGFVLTCQARPTSPSVRVDYDAV